MKKVKKDVNTMNDEQLAKHLFQPKLLKRLNKIAHENDTKKDDSQSQKS